MPPPNASYIPPPRSLDAPPQMHPAPFHNTNKQYNNRGQILSGQIVGLFTNNLMQVILTFGTEKDHTRVGLIIIRMNPTIVKITTGHGSRMINDILPTPQRIPEIAHSTGISSTTLVGNRTFLHRKPIMATTTASASTPYRPTE